MPVAVVLFLLQGGGVCSPSAAPRAKEKGDAASLFFLRLPNQRRGEGRQEPNKGKEAENDEGQGEHTTQSKESK